MQYLGGKYYQAKVIAEHIAQLRKPGQQYLEPFLGAASVYCRVPEPKSASDIHPDLVAMWQAMQRGWVPPSSMPEGEWRQLKASPGVSPERAFAGFGCSFGGKWFGGYARGEGKDYPSFASRSIARKRPGLVGIVGARDYREHEPDSAIIYCDPPYASTTGYTAGAFDHVEFWATMRRWAKSSTVLVTEYTVPGDVEVLHIFERTQSMRSKSGDNMRRELLVRVHA